MLIKNYWLTKILYKFQLGIFSEMKRDFP